MLVARRKLKLNAPPPPPLHTTDDMNEWELLIFDWLVECGREQHPELFNRIIQCPTGFRPAMNFYIERTLATDAQMADAIKRKIKFQKVRRAVLKEFGLPINK